MDFVEHDRVRIIDKDITGVIIDIFTKDNGEKVYIIEPDELSTIDDEDNLGYSMQDCIAEEIEKID